MEQVSNSGPPKAWNLALYNSNMNEQIENQIKELKEEEYYQKLKQRGINADFKRIEMEKLKGTGEEDVLKKNVYDSRSRRLTTTAKEEAEAPAPASQASKKSNVSKPPTHASQAASQPAKSRAS